MNKLLKTTLLAFSIGLITFLVGNYLFNGYNFKNASHMLFNFGLYQMYAVVICFSNVYFFQFIGKINWQGKYRYRIPSGVLGSLIITLFCLFIVKMFIEMYLFQNSFEAFMSKERIGFYIFGMSIASVAILIFYGIFFFKEKQDKRVKESQIIAKTEVAKFESLKSQLDPHFLFNSLNVLTSLIEENPKHAEKFTTKLSKVYRYVLEQKDKDLVSIIDEINFAKSYMELLQMRFEDALYFEMPVFDEESDLKIIPLSLQLLLENAVKHNVTTSESPLHIKIYQSQNYLVIENNCSPKKALGESTRIGLKNIENRYELISKDKVEIINENNLFIVKLPLLTQKIKQMDTRYLTNEKRYSKAQDQVTNQKYFYRNLATYLVMMPFLIFINYRTNSNFQWFWFPVFGGAISIIIHAVQVFLLNNDWESKKIKKQLEKDNI